MTAEEFLQILVETRDRFFTVLIEVFELFGIELNVTRSAVVRTHGNLYRSRLVLTFSAYPRWVTWKDGLDDIEKLQICPGRCAERFSVTLGMTGFLPVVGPGVLERDLLTAETTLGRVPGLTGVG